MDKTRNQSRGGKASSGKTGGTKKQRLAETMEKVNPVENGDLKEVPFEEVHSDEAASEAGAEIKDEVKMVSKSQPKKTGKKGNLFTLPKNNGKKPAGDKPKVDLSEPIDEENLRALLVDLRNDITALKKEQEEVPLAPQNEEAHLYGLLAALKDDINDLKAEQESNTDHDEEAQMFDMLAELKSDIRNLKAEQEIHHAPEGEEHLYELLADLKSDIKVLKAEQKHHTIAEGEEHLYELLADLKGDIKVLKAEQAIPLHAREEEHLYGVLAELKQDVNVLKHDHDETPVAGGASRSGGLVYMMAGAFIVMVVLAAGAGGYYFSVYQRGIEAIMLAPVEKAEATDPVAKTDMTEPEGEAAGPKMATVADSALRNVSGKPGEAIEPKINLTGAYVKPGTAIVLGGIPEGFELSAGNRTEDGEWVMTIWDTLRLTLTSPQHYKGDFAVTVSLMDAKGELSEREKFSVAIDEIAAPAMASEGAVAAANKPVPAPASMPELSTPEQLELIERAGRLMDQGDIVSARNVLDYAVSRGSPTAAFRLAQTYDPLYLGKMKSVLGVQPDLVKAKVLYYFAAKNGHEEATKRLSGLREESGASKP